MSRNRQQSTSIDTNGVLRCLEVVTVAGRRGSDRPTVSTRSTRFAARGQALVEYVLLLGLLTAVAVVVRPLLTGAVTAAGIRFLLGLVGLD